MFVHRSGSVRGTIEGTGRLSWIPMPSLQRPRGTRQVLPGLIEVVIDEFDESKHPRPHVKMPQVPRKYQGTINSTEDRKGACGTIGTRLEEGLL